MDLPASQFYSDQLQAIANLMDDQEYDQARLNLEALSTKDLSSAFLHHQGQDVPTFALIKDVQDTLKAMVDRELEYLDDDHVMHELERLAKTMRQVEEIDEQIMLALGQMGAARSLN